MHTKAPFKWRRARDREYFAVCLLVLAVRTQLSGSGGNGGGTRTLSEPYDDLSLGLALCARVGEAMSSR